MLCFLLSGAAGLVYQTAWTREFAFVFGTSELAVATVLAAYMGGLALGSAIAARYVTRVRRPILAYGLLELGVALSALLVPVGLAGAQALHVSLFGGREALPGAGGTGAALFYLAFSFAILAVPTSFMGATLPLLARQAIHDDRQVTPRIGLLYAANTAGAVVGTILAGFALLPLLGLRGTVFVAVALNAAVFVVAAGLARHTARRTPPAVAAAARSLAAADRMRSGWILPAILLSGAVSFSYEVLFTRLLGHLLGGSVYAFATMLASFLTGIALGSVWAGRKSRTPSQARRSFAVAQLGTAVFALVAFIVVGLLPELRSQFDAAGRSLLSDVLIAAATLLPATLFIGATFPMAVRVLAVDAEDAARASARVYAWNTLGAILGAIGAAFFLLPRIGYEGLIALAVAVNLFLALFAAWPRRGEQSGRLVAVAAAVGLIALSVVRPVPPWNLLRSSPLGDWSLGEKLYYEVGRSATVLLLEQGGSFRLRTNGLPESTIDSASSPPSREGLAHWLGLLPSLVHPNVETLLVIGLGGGLALEGVAPTVREIDVVELEPEVVRANEAIADRRAVDPLADPRLRIIENDARGALALTERRYDAIVSQPSHPWTAGSSHLYTREFFELVHGRLSPGGVFVQWIGLPFVDLPLLRTIVATLRDVYEQVQIFSPVAGGVLFVSSDVPMDVAAAARIALASAPDHLAASGLRRPEDVLAALLLDDAGTRAFAGDAPVSTDDRNLLQMRSPGVVRRESGVKGFSAEVADLDPLAEPTPGLDRAALAERLALLGFPVRARRVASATPDRAERLAALGVVDAQLRRPGARASLTSALELRPDLPLARAAFLRMTRGEPDPAPPDGLDDAGLDAFETTMVDAWRREAQDGPAALDDALAAFPRVHPLWTDAQRARIRWRTDDPAAPPEHLREAIALLDVLAPIDGRSGDLLQRARLGERLGDPELAYASLAKLALTLQPRGADGPQLARQALEILARLPASHFDPGDQATIATRLRNVARTSTQKGVARGSGSRGIEPGAR